MASKRTASPSGEENGASSPKKHRITGEPLSGSFYEQESEAFARSLLGKLLVRVLEDGTKLAGYVVDAEAYPGGDDKASHSHDGKKTGHNAAMYMPPGTAYVHNTFGGHCTMYVTCKGEGAVALIRAIEPIKGITKMRELRSHKREDKGEGLEDADLTSGPAKLTQALGITRSLVNKSSLICSKSLWLEEGRTNIQAEDVATGHRIGIEAHGACAEKQWRFHIRNNEYVSVVDKAEGGGSRWGSSHKAEVVAEVDLENITAKHRLSTAFYTQSATDLARALLGKVLVRELEGGDVVRGRIVDTEAYPGGEDEASHSHGGKNGNNSATFMAPGTMYIHNTFGGNTTFYISSDGDGACVMVRALEPVSGTASMRAGRGRKKGTDGSAFEETEIASGPAKLTQALAIKRADFNRADLRAADNIWIEDIDSLSEGQDFSVGVSPRVGQEEHGEWGLKEWRFFIQGNKHLSVQEKSVKAAKPAGPRKPLPAVKPVKVDIDAISAPHRLSTAFYSQSAQDLARALLGKVVVRQCDDGTTLKCVVVETEAFPGTEDPASHSYEGKQSGHNAALYLEPGTLYVHNTFGGNCSLYVCSQGDGAAVLLRALEPVEGLDVMRAGRGKKMEDQGAKLETKDFCSGPAKLTQAMQIKRDKVNKQDLRVCDFMWVEERDDKVKESDIVECKRVGIKGHGEFDKKPWRYYIRGNSHVSQVDKTAEKAME